MATLGAENLNNRVIVIPTSGMNGNSGRFIDDDDIVIFVNDAYREACDGRFVSMKGMRNDLAILNHSVATGRFPIDGDET